jgi:hypothetical protein
MNQGQKKVNSSQESDQWLLNIKTEAATLKGSYNSALVVQRIVKNLRRILNPTGQVATTFEEAVKLLTQRILLEIVNDSLVKALERSEIEAQKKAIRELSNDDFSIKSDKLKEWMEEVARGARIESRRRMGARMRGGSEPKYPLEELNQYYESLLLTWRDAKRIYRENRRRSNWRVIVKTIHSNLPPDLIDKLNISSERPSDLAIEHAARCCGAPKNCYSIRWLRQRLRRNR